ncbi:transposase [Hymenobacter sp. 5317J-9]|uniref:transposase n=1 Tax=Hymenobacter sp. 5317J-9 TaxID=2932250 RepID=UPI001FD68F4A|nr:transposase [Hymenobacter sp. 5317J-9]UOR00022.1 transposase [Hymenobacter sp. 5317J-9]
MFGQYKPDIAGFAYDRGRDAYTCAAGKALPFHRLDVTTDGSWVKLYWAAYSDCQHCPLKPTCVPGAKRKQLTKTIYDAAYRRAWQRQQSRRGHRHRRLRQSTVEPVFGHLLHHYGLRRMNVRGQAGAHKTMLLTAAAYNLKKLLKYRPQRQLSLAVALPPPLLAANARVWRPNRHPEAPTRALAKRRLSNRTDWTEFCNSHDRFCELLVHQRVAHHAATRIKTKTNARAAPGVATAGTRSRATPGPAAVVGHEATQRRARCTGGHLGRLHTRRPRRSLCCFSHLMVAQARPGSHATVAPPPSSVPPTAEPSAPVSPSKEGGNSPSIRFNQSIASQRPNMKKPFLSLLALAALASCSKQNDPPAPPTLSRTELLTASPWKLTAQREVLTPPSGGAAVVTDYPVVAGALVVAYKTDGTVSANRPLQQGNPVAGGIYALTDSTLWTNVGAGSGIVRELTAHRLVLVDKWQGPTGPSQRADVYLH